MIFSINSIFWLLQLNDNKFVLEWNNHTPISMLSKYESKRYLSAENAQLLSEILSFYLLLRNSIVNASKSVYAHPTGYESKYFDEIAKDVVKRMGIDSPASLEKVVFN